MTIHLTTTAAAPTCPAECPNCLGAAKERAPIHSGESTLKGRALVLTAALTFLLPLLGCLVGTLLAGRDALPQLFGAGLGLIAALALTTLLVPRLLARLTGDR